MKHCSRAICLLFALLAAAAISQAAPKLLSYQGRVTDPSNNPVSDATYPATFSLFPVPVGGAAVWSETSSITTVAGLFSYTLGSVTAIPDTLFPRVSPLYLEVTVNGQVQTPRTQMVAAPFSLGVHTIDRSLGGVITGDISVRNPGGNERIDLETSAPGTRLVIDNDATTPGYGLWLQATASSGLISMWDYFSEDEGASFGVDPYPLLRMIRDSNLAGINIQGSQIGAFGDEPLLEFTGSTDTIVFDFKKNGDSLARFPEGVINSRELSNEPGIATSAFGVSSVALAGGLQTLRSRSITIPDSGYVMVIASAHAVLTHTSGTASEAIFGVSNTNASLPSNQDIETSVPSGAATGIYDIPVTAHTVFQETSGGTKTYYFLANELSGSVNVADEQFTLLYFPTAYGTFTAPVPSVADEYEIAPVPTGYNQTTRTSLATGSRQEVDLAATVQQLLERVRILEAKLQKQDLTNQ